MCHSFTEADVTAKRVADEYKANVASTTENSGSAVTNSFVDIAFRMADLDELPVGSEFANSETPFGGGSWGGGGPTKRV